MKSSSVSIRKALNFAWATFQKRYALFAAIVLALFGSWIALEIVVIAGQRLGLGIGPWIVAHLLFFILFAGLEVGFLQEIGRAHV